MRRFLSAFRRAGAATAAVAGLLAVGCEPKPVDPPAADPVSAESADIGDRTKAETVDDAERSPLPQSDPVASVAETPASDSSSASPGLTIEKPGDFLEKAPAPSTPTESTEPAEPPEVVTDASSEADEPLALPGGTPIGDVFEGIGAPKPAPE